MKIKIQNFLFLLFCAFIGKLIYIALLMIIISLAMLNQWFALDNYLSYLHFPAECFYPLAIAAGVLNLCHTRLATHIYRTVHSQFPKLQWYSLFLGGILIIKEFITEPQLIILLLIGCITAALCNKKQPWQQRFIPATVFFVMLISFLSGHFLNLFINN